MLDSMTDREPRLAALPLVAMFLSLLILGSPGRLAAAQVSAGTGGSLSSGSVFGAPAPHGGGDLGGSGGGGGQYHPPPDGGAPGGGDAPSQGGGAVAPPAGGGRGAAGAETGGAAPGTRGDSSRSDTSGGASTSSASVVDDSWSAWWEANKFDYIQLRRVEDVLTGGHGVEQETPAQRERRLAQLRATVRDMVLPELRTLTASDDSAVRAAAIVALGKLHDESSVDTAARLLADSSLQVRRSAMLALGVLATGRSSWLLMNVADDNKTGRDLVESSPVPVDDRGTALLSVTLRGELAAADLIEGLLASPGDGHPELVALAAAATGLMGATDSIRLLIPLTYDASLPQYVRSAATSALGRIGDPSVTPVLMGLLDQDLEPRRAAILALGQVAEPGSGRTVVERLVAILDRDADATSRHFAAIALGRIGGPDAIKALAASLSKARDDARPWIALGLGLCGRSEATASVVPVLVERIRRETSPDTLGACLIALGLCGGDPGLVVLTGALHHANASVAGHAAMALGLSGQGAATAPLQAALSSSNDPLVLRQAALALGILGDRTSIPALLDLIRITRNPFVASYAAIGIGFIGDSNAAGPLLDLIRREGPLGVTTTYAVAAVGQLFDLDRRPALSRLAAGDNYLSRVSAVGDLLDLGF